MVRDRMTKSSWLMGTAIGLTFLVASAGGAVTAQSVLQTQKQRAPASGEKLTWKPVDFAIVRYNDDAPASWNMYHGEKKGLLLIRLWRRDLVLNIQDQEVYALAPPKSEMARRKQCRMVAFGFAVGSDRNVGVESARRGPDAPSRLSVREGGEFFRYPAALANQRQVDVLNVRSKDAMKQRSNDLPEENYQRR